MTKSFFYRWDRWWTRKDLPHILAIFRIAFGSFLLLEALTYVQAVPTLFSSQGLVFSIWADAFPMTIRSLFEPPSVAVAWLIFSFYCLCSVTLALGIAMRTSLFSLLLLFLYYWQLSFHDFPSSYHRLFFTVLLILLFSGADKTFSLHMRLRRGSFFAFEEISILPQRLLALQITATYIGVASQKIWLPDWQTGEVLIASFSGKWATPWGFVLTRTFSPAVFEFLNWIVRLGEFFLPFCLWNREWRWKAIIAGTLFHVSVAVFMSIWWFLVLPPAYVLFFDPREVHSWLSHHLPIIKKR